MQVFHNILSQFKEILEDIKAHSQLISAIMAIGVFSKAIKHFLNEQTLKSYLEKLIELSE